MCLWCKKWARFVLEMGMLKFEELNAFPRKLIVQLEGEVLLLEILVISVKKFYLLDWEQYLQIPNIMFQ